MEGHPSRTASPTARGSLPTRKMKCSLQTFPLKIIHGDVHVCTPRCLGKPTPRRFWRWSTFPEALHSKQGQRNRDGKITCLANVRPNLREYFAREQYVGPKTKKETELNRRCLLACLLAATTSQEMHELHSPVLQNFHRQIDRTNLFVRKSDYII